MAATNSSGNDPFAGTDPLVQRPYDPTEAQEKVRGRVTFTMMALFGLILGVYLSGAFFGSDPHWTRIKEAMQAVLPAVTSLLGTVIGFYFGAQKR